MSEWKKIKLGDISTACLGKMLDRQKNKGSYQPYLANINVRWGRFDFDNLNEMRFEPSEAERYGLQYGDLVICEGGEPGRCALWKDQTPRMKIQKALHRVRINGSHSNEFVYYRFLLAGKTGGLEKHFVGSTIKHLTGVGLKDVEFTYPSLAAQQKIARVLSTLDAKIELNRRINAELEGMAKLFYDYWFVQFDFPISAAQAAAMGKPQLEGQPYQSSGGKMTFNETLKRKIPEGWEAGKVSQCCRLNENSWGTGNAPPSLIYLDLANVKNGSMISSQIYDWKSAPSRARRILTDGDTIIGTVRPGNRSYCLVPKSEQILTGSTGFAVLSPVSIKYREFNYLTLTSELNIERLSVVASGAAYPAVKPEVVADITIAQPNKELISKYHSTVGSSFDLMAQNAQQTQHLTTLRDFLLPMLMNGQVTVK